MCENRRRTGIFINDHEKYEGHTLDNFDGGRQVGELFRKQGHRSALYIADDIAVTGRMCAFSDFDGIISQEKLDAEPESIN